MSYKDELKKQIEQLENKIISDNHKIVEDEAELSKLYRQLADIQLKERIGEQPVSVQLLQG